MAGRTILANRKAKEKTMAKSRRKQKDMLSLRSLVEERPECAQKFGEAEQLAQGIFQWKGGRVALPYFTTHGIEHCENVENHLDKILFPEAGQAVKDFTPSAEEAMYLLSAAWLHDIGMIYGIFNGEKPIDLANNTDKVKALRGEHEVRTSRYILEKWELNCDWTPEEKTLLANICHFHRRRHNMMRFKPASTISKIDGKTIHLAVLTSLVRLADGCDVDQSRAPGFLRAFYDAIGMPPEAVYYWEGSEMISHVSFDHTERKIELVGLSPPIFDFRLGKFDLRELVEGTRDDVEDELRSVQPVLMGYPNTGFMQVDCTINPVNALAVKTGQRCLAVWPYLLHRPSSATEGCAALVQLLWFASHETQDFDRAWIDKIGQMMEECLRSRPYDFMVKNLCFEIEKIISRDPFGKKNGNELVEYLEGYLRNCLEMRRALAVPMRTLVESSDVLILYGYSTNVAGFLENIQRTHTGPLYIIDCHYIAEKRNIAVNENEKIAEVAMNLGFKTYFVGLPDLAQVLANLRKEGDSCKVVLGSHGVLRSGDLACKVGTYAVAITAKEFKVPVFAFAESNKFLMNGEDDREVVSPQKVLVREDSQVQIGTTKVRSVTAQMDIVPRSLITAVVTERGVQRDRAPVSK